MGSMGSTDISIRSPTPCRGQSITPIHGLRQLVGQRCEAVMVASPLMITADYVCGNDGVESGRRSGFSQGPDCRDKPNQSVEILPLVL